MQAPTSTSLLPEFLANVRLAAATAEVIPANSAALTEALDRATAGDETVLIAPPTDLDSDLFGPFMAGRKAVAEPTKEQLKTVRTGITDAFCGVASTGSVCVSAGVQVNAFLGMLTRNHIVVLDARTIVPRPRNVLSEEYLGGKGLQRSFSYITGPSATADMGPLVRGVHGPGKLHIIVLE